MSVQDIKWPPSNEPHFKCMKWLPGQIIFSETFNKRQHCKCSGLFLLLKEIISINTNYEAYIVLTKKLTSGN